MALLKRSLRFLTSITLIFALTLSIAPSASASINDDRYDGNIFVVYAGNGSLVPPRLTLQQSLERKIPAILVYYVDDNSDSKQYATVVSRLQEYYGKAASILPIAVDALPVKSKYAKDEEGYYYQGFIPQTVIIDGEGKEVFNQKGQLPYEEVDDALREVFELLPRSESEPLVRKQLNSLNVELSN